MLGGLNIWAHILALFPIELDLFGWTLNFNPRRIYLNPVVHDQQF